MATLFSRSRVAGVALAASLLITACGGGSGGTEPPPPPVDKAPPTVFSTDPDKDADGIDDGLTQITVTMKEDGGNIKCPTKNPLTVTKENGEEIKGGDPACDPATKVLSLTFATKVLFRCEVYTATLAAGIEDMATPSNKSATYVWSFKTSGCDYKKMLFTANNGASHGQPAISGVDPSNGQVTGYLETPADGAYFQWSVAADPKVGKVYSAAYKGGRGIDVLDVDSGVVKNVKLNPSQSVRDFIESLAMKGSYAWAAYSNRCIPYDAAFCGRLFMLDRLTDQVTGKTVAVTESEKTPVRLVAHPVSTEHLLYSLNATISAIIGGIECGSGVCQEVRLPGTPGTVTVINSDDGSIVGNPIPVGSVPLAAVIDPATGLMYAINAGDDTVSIVNLKTRVTTTKSLGFTGYQQAAGIELLFGKLWVSDYLGAVHVYDLNLVPVGTVSTGALSMPSDIVALDGKLYVTLFASAFSAVAEINPDNLSVKTVTVGSGPRAITAYAP